MQAWFVPEPFQACTPIILLRIARTRTRRLCIASGSKSESSWAFALMNLNLPEEVYHLALEVRWHVPPLCVLAPGALGRPCHGSHDGRTANERLTYALQGSKKTSKAGSYSTRTKALNDLGNLLPRNSGSVFNHNSVGGKARS